MKGARAAWPAERRGVGAVAAAQAIVSFSRLGRCRNDAAIRSVRMCSATAQPASRREWQSITVARYRFDPSAIGMR